MQLRAGKRARRWPTRTGLMDSVLEGGVKESPGVKQFWILASSNQADRIDCIGSASQPSGDESPRHRLVVKGKRDEYIFRK